MSTALTHADTLRLVDAVQDGEGWTMTINNKCLEDESFGSAAVQCLSTTLSGSPKPQ